MAEIIQVPVGTPSWQQRVSLDGQNYYLSCVLNERLNRWFFSMSDDTQTPIIEGRKILASKNLLRGIAAGNRPPGVLMAVDLSGKDRNPNYTTLGTEIALVYVPFDLVP